MVQAHSTYFLVSTSPVRSMQELKGIPLYHKQNQSGYKAEVLF